MLTRQLACNVGLALAVTCSCASSGLIRSVSTTTAATASPLAFAVHCELPQATRSTAYALRFDQVGYLPEANKWAVVLGEGGPAPEYRVYDLATGCSVASGTAGPRVLDTMSHAGTRLTGDRVDLSGIPRAGRYMVALGDGAQFGPVVVDAGAYAEVVPMLVRFLRAQRCGPTSQAISQHAACHLHASLRAYSGDGIAVDDGYTGKVDTGVGPAVDVEGGWHDAGDYIKFVGTTAFTLAVDLLALRDHPGAFPSALSVEMRWGLDWIVRMLGGAVMLHQVSGEKDHDTGFRLPDLDTSTPVPGYVQRPAFRFAPGKGGNLLGRSAAALALGSQVFANDAPYAASLLALAKTVYVAGSIRTVAQSPDPADFYEEDSVDDDLSLGAAVLAQVTGDAKYAGDALAHARALGPVPSKGEPLYWGDVRALAYLETALAEPKGSPERTEMSAALAALAAPILVESASATGPGGAFRYALTSFGNGSVEQALGAAAVCLAAHRLGSSPACAEVARTQLHWLFGQNPFGVSFMVGAGTSNPANLHHALAQAGHLTLTGAIVGGPASMSVLRGAHDESLPLPGAKGPFARWSTDALVYEDEAADYVVNEPAIDFTAPLVFILGELAEGA
jgi:endoglucanase